MLAHEFPCKQHSDFRSARQRRKHINILLLDNCEEYSRTYGADGRPQEHASISAALAKYKNRKCNPLPSSQNASNLLGKPRDLWLCAYAEGGQEAADLCKMVNRKRTPIGTFFGLANPSLPRSGCAKDTVPNMRPLSLTEARFVCNCIDM
jgi:hypothetical protein